MQAVAAVITVPLHLLDYPLRALPVGERSRRLKLWTQLWYGPERRKIWAEMHAPSDRSRGAVRAEGEAVYRDSSKGMPCGDRCFVSDNDMMMRWEEVFHQELLVVSW
jgi:hypothetical protein